MVSRSECPDEQPPTRPEELSGLVHDLSNALTVIEGWATAALSLSHEQRLRALSIIVRRAAAARTMARSALGKDGPPKGRQRLLELVVGGVEAIEPEVRARGIVLERRTDATLDDVVVDDAHSFSRVLENLLLNALSHSPDGTKIHVESSTDGPSRIRVLVRDEGAGVPPGSEQAIFEGLSSRPGGVGIGLAQSRALARRNGGDLILSDSQRSGGARFVLIWPASAEQATDRTSGAEAARPEGTVDRPGLMLEDDMDLCEFVELALCKHGIAMARCDDWGDLLGRTDFPPSAVLLDKSPLRPDVVGRLGQLRRLLPRAQIVLMTAESCLEPHEREAMQRFSIELLRKPFDGEELVRCLAGYVQTQ